jgi:hypothetical protein
MTPQSAPSRPERENAHDAQENSAQAGSDSVEIEVKKHRAWVFRRVRSGQRSKFFYVKGRLQNGAQFLRCTGCATQRDATKAGRALFAAALEENLAALTNWRQRREGPRVATFAELFAAYDAHIARADTMLRPESAEGYVRAMQQLVGWTLGLQLPAGRGQAGRRQVDAAAVGRESLELLADEGLPARFEAAYLARAGASPLARAKALRGAHRIWRNARSLFSRRAMACYARLTLPTLTSFLGAQLHEAEPVRHRKLDDETVAEMTRAADALRDTNAGVWLVNLLARHCALRPIEIEAARVGWLVPRRKPALVRLPPRDGFPQGEDRSVVAELRVEKTDAFDPKGSEGIVPLAPDVWALLQPLLAGRAADDFLVAATDAAERKKLIYREHSAFMRPWTKDHQKTTYELRRWCRTKIKGLHGGVNEMADAFLRHAPRSVGEKHYETERPLPAPITLADCQGA